MPSVSGRVIEVVARPNTPLKTGDVLFRIDPEPFENAVKAREASLVDAVQASAQLKAVANSASKQL